MGGGQKEIIMNQQIMGIIQKGSQIAYVPNHAEGNLSHPDVEFGFVTSIRDNIAFCRYWSKDSFEILRTKANSEATPLNRIVLHISTAQSNINKLLADIEAELKST